MKVVFCTDDKPRYLTLLKVAVRSLREVMGQDAPCLSTRRNLRTWPNQYG